MTKEEAIKQITDILEYFEDRIERETDPAFDKEIAKKDADALHMAIKALEQEPCEDCISRQAVLDCLTVTKLKKFDFILRAREEIKKLPPVNPQKNIVNNGTMNITL